MRLPDPESDWVGFERVVQNAVKRADDTWDVRRKCFAPWVDMDTIRYLYGGGGFANNERGAEGGRREGGDEGKDMGRMDIEVRIGNETGGSHRVGRSLSPPRRTRSGEGGTARALSNPGRRERQRRVSDGSSSMSPSVLSLASSLGHSGPQGSMSLRAPWHTERTSTPPANAETAFTDTVPRASSPRAGSRSGSPLSRSGSPLSSTTSRRRGTFFGTCKSAFYSINSTSPCACMAFVILVTLISLDLPVPTTPFLFLSLTPLAPFTFSPHRSYPSSNTPQTRSTRCGFFG